MIKLIIILVMPCLLFANNIFGVVVKVKGKPTVDGKSVGVDDTLFDKQTVYTDADSKMIIKQANDNTIVVGKNSMLYLNNKEFVTQKKGTLLYDIAVKTLAKTHHFNIKLKTATIGIRGTNFIVKSETQRDAVFLRKGSLEFVSDKGKFALYKKKQMDEFAKFKNQFEAYKKDIMKDFKHYKEQQMFVLQAEKKQFLIHKNSVVVFEGNKAYKENIAPKTLQNYFNSFDSFIQTK